MQMTFNDTVGGLKQPMWVISRREGDSQYLCIILETFFPPARVKIGLQKSRTRETLSLSTDADHRTDI